MQSKLSHRHSLFDNLKTQASFSYSPNKEVSLDATFKKDMTPLMTMSGDVVLSMPGREMKFYKSLEQKSADVFNHEMIMQWQKGGQVCNGLDTFFLGMILYYMLWVVVPMKCPFCFVTI